MEKIIARRLKAGDSLQKIAEDALKKADSPRNNARRVMETGRFLYNAGLFKKLLLWSADRLESGRFVPWPFVVKTLTDHQIAVSGPKARSLYQIAGRATKETAPFIFACKSLGEEVKEWDLARAVFLDDLRERNLNKKEELLKNLEFAEAQGLLEEEEQIILQLLETEGGSLEYRRLYEKFQKKKALQFIKKHKGPRSHAKQAPAGGFAAGGFATGRGSAAEGSRADKIFLFQKRLAGAAAACARKHPEKAKDLAVFLYMTGRPEDGLQLLEESAEQESAAFLRLEWLLEAGGAASAVESANQLLARSPADPEKLFFINYIKACSLYRLGEKRKAIQYLNDIAAVRPDYKNVQALKELWLSE